MARGAAASIDFDWRCSGQAIHCSDKVLVMKSNETRADGRKNSLLLYRAADSFLRCGLRLLPAWSWTESLALRWGYHFRPQPCVVKLRSGAWIHVDPTDYLQLIIYYLGTFEPHC